MSDAAPHWIFLALAAPLLGALVAPLLTRMLGGGAAGWVLALIPAALFAGFFGLTGPVSEGRALTAGFAWIPQLGARFSLLVDGLSLAFALLITGIGALILIYSGAYLRGHPHQGRFLAFLLLFMAAMLGLVLADDFLTLFFFWELTSFASFLLIGFDHAREAARRAAIQALVVTGAGGLALLAGLLLIRTATGAGSMSEALALGGSFLAHPLYLPVLLLVLSGAATKSAQFPFHFWLANAMEAPTPVSAYLHSATMVKAGVYLLLRTAPFLGGSVAWTMLLTLLGAATLVVGALLALRQTDMKLMLAYTTVASLGLLVLLTGTGTGPALNAAAAYLVAHALFKGALFMAVGGIDHEAGARDLTELGGLGREMKLTFAAALIAAASMGGLPLTLGFFAKEGLYGAQLAAPVLLAATVLANAVLFAAGFAVALTPFIGRRLAPRAKAQDGPAALWLGPLVLALGGIAAMLFSTWTGARLLGPLAAAAGGDIAAPAPGLALHWGAPLLLSALTLALGVLAWWRLAELRHACGRLLAAIGWGPDRGFDQLVSGLTRLGARVTRVVQNGDLETYMAAIFACTALILLVPMTLFGEWPAWPAMGRLLLHEWAVLLLALAGLVIVLANRNRLIAIVSLGIQGFAVALIFLLFGAPDLSFTQFMVETLSVVILALAMTRLRLSPSDHRSMREVVKDGTIALACGVGLTALLLAVVARPFDDRLSAFFTEHSRAIAHGRNIVNVIIVDYRGLDTLGEIAVVMVAGLAILALLRVRAAWRRPDAEAGA
jgi:multicomponent Na+:H+ antiporter subunit A